MKQKRCVNVQQLFKPTLKQKHLSICHTLIYVIESFLSLLTKQQNHPSTL